MTLPKRFEHSPWGAIDTVVPTSIPDIIWASTPSHGGMFVGPDSGVIMQRAFPNLWKLGIGPWFEEDCAWAAVMVAFPQLAESTEALDGAHSTVKAWYPHAYRLDAGFVTLEESYVLQREDHARRVQGQLVSGSAVGDWCVGASNYTAHVDVSPGYVGVLFWGSTDRRGTPTIGALVPARMYKARGSFGMILDKDPTKWPIGVHVWPRT